MLFYTILLFAILFFVFYLLFVEFKKDKIKQLINKNDKILKLNENEKLELKNNNKYEYDYIILEKNSLLTLHYNMTRSKNKTQEGGKLYLIIHKHLILKENSCIHLNECGYTNNEDDDKDEMKQINLGKGSGDRNRGGGSKFYILL